MFSLGWSFGRASSKYVDMSECCGVKRGCEPWVWGWVVARVLVARGLLLAVAGFVGV
ncbi:MAG: hypothetical protein FWD57_15860 [Polyangiaceae bacterium]|nr:hypothetical protein [Polyangiaceae bacterium]